MQPHRWGIRMPGLRPDRSSLRRVCTFDSCSIFVPSSLCLQLRLSDQATAGAGCFEGSPHLECQNVSNRYLPANCFRKLRLATLSIPALVAMAGDFGLKREPVCNVFPRVRYTICCYIWTNLSTDYRDYLGFPETVVLLSKSPTSSGEKIAPRRWFSWISLQDFRD